MANLLEQFGAQPQRQPKYVPIFMDRQFTGLFTQRAALHDPSSVIEAKYYGGRPDALWMGENVELTNRLTLQRRPGFTPFSTTTYPTPPDRSFSFQLSNGTIRVIFDTESTGFLTVTSVSTESAGVATYTGVFPGGVNNAYMGLLVQIAGFVNAPNNGTFLCVGSSGTTLLLDNPNAISEVDPATAISSGAVYWDQQNGTKTLLFAKSPGAGPSYFVGVAGVMYVGDGVDTWKWTPLNPNLPAGSNVSVWNWGIVAPTTQPNVIQTASGAALPLWQANTVYSTMGLTVDSFGNAWQLIGVNADGSNTANAIYGTSGSGGPPWNQALFGNTLETGGTPITWKNVGPINQWQPGTQYGDMGFATIGGTPAPTCVWDPVTQAVFGNFHNSGGLGTSSNKKPNFNLTAGASFIDGTCKWFLLGTFPGVGPASGQLKAWLPSHIYSQWAGQGNNGQDVAVEPFLLPPGATQPVYIQVPINGGTSGSVYTPFPNPANGPVNFGQRQTDGQLLWLNLGSTTWQSNTSYIPWTVPGAAFNVIQVSGFMYVCTPAPGSNPSILRSHTGSVTDLPFTSNQNYGQIVIDGSGASQIAWVCVGPQVTWTASTIWNLPLAGFAPPQTSQAFGGSTIISNTNLVESVIVSGKSGVSQPSWNPVNQKTTDNTITWFAESTVQAQSLSWQNGLAYAYAYKSLAFDDFYAALPVGGGNIPPGITTASSSGLNNFAWTGIPRGSATNAVSSASPAFQIVGPNTGAVNTVSGIGSTDPQVDTIIIFRSADSANGSAQMFELTEIPAPPPIDGVAQPWSFKDFLPSLPTSVFPGLNLQLPAPIDDVNDPPDSAFLPMVYNFQRIWGADGEFVPFSGGPDTEIGNPNEAFPPTNELPFLAPVIRLVKTTQGLVTFLTDSIEVIGGGPETASFFSVTWVPGIGLSDYTALDILAGEIYFFGSDNQFHIMTPSLNVTNAGFALGDQFANLPSSGVPDTTWNPASVYVASHQSGIDNCVFVADGSTGWYRLNANQAGAGITTLVNPVWSVFAKITNGAGLVQSVEVSPGVKKLLVGSTLPNQPVLERNLSVYTDNGTPYDAWFVMGSITLAHPGELALLKFMEFDFNGVKYQPKVSYLLNEIAGTFTTFQQAPQFDPPQLYGTTLSPKSYSPNRYYFAGNASLARCRHLQLMIDFGVTPNPDELFTATIFGRIMVET